MSITLNLAPEIEAALIEQARVHGMPVDAYVESLVEQSDARLLRQGRASGTSTAFHQPPSPALTAAEEETRKVEFRVKIDELARRAKELDAQYPPQDDPVDEEDSYTQALLEKFRRKGIPLR